MDAGEYADKRAEWRLTRNTKARMIVLWESIGALRVQLLSSVEKKSRRRGVKRGVVIAEPALENAWKRRMKWVRRKVKIGKVEDEDGFGSVDASSMAPLNLLYFSQHIERGRLSEGFLWWTRALLPRRESERFCFGRGRFRRWRLTRSLARRHRNW